MDQLLLHYNTITDFQNFIDFRNSMKNNCFWLIFCYDIKLTFKHIDFWKLKIPISWIIIRLLHMQYTVYDPAKLEYG